MFKNYYQNFCISFAILYKLYRVFLHQFYGILDCLLFKLPKATLFSWLNLYDFRLEPSFLSRLWFITFSQSREFSKLLNLFLPVTIVGSVEPLV